MEKTENELVSVIIPCYNVSTFIELCVESVVTQSYKNLEIICVDNNSSDNTFAILEQLQSKFKQVQIATETKPGASAARNKGLGMAKGKWIQFLDADDLIENQKIEHQINLLSNHPNTQFVAAAWVKLRTDGEMEYHIDLSNDKHFATFVNKSGNTCSNLWLKECLLKVGSWNENINSSQEADLMLRLASNGANFIIDEVPLTIIRDRDKGQISQRDPILKWKQFLLVRFNYLHTLESTCPEVFKKNNSMCYVYLLGYLQNLAKIDLAKANEFYQNHFSNTFGQHSLKGSAKLKFLFIQYFGFPFAFSLKQKLNF